jgi:hypothetical protein
VPSGPQAAEQQSPEILHGAPVSPQVDGAHAPSKHEPEQQDVDDSQIAPSWRQTVGPHSPASHVPLQHVLASTQGNPSGWHCPPPPVPPPPTPPSSGALSESRAPQPARASRSAAVAATRA